MYRFVILVWFWSLTLPWVQAEQAPTASEPDKKPNFFSELLQDQKRIWSAPLRKSTWDRPQTYLFIGVTGASFALDDDPARKLREDPSFDCFNSILDSTAADVSLTVLPLAVWVTGELTDSAAVSDYGRTISRAAIAGFTVSSAFKAAALRDRPHTGSVYGFWEGGSSFPSGHSAVAWSIAASSVRHFKGKKWVPWVAFPAAGLISFSRVTSGNHFPSDTVAGSLLGFAIGFYGIE